MPSLPVSNAILHYDIEGSGPILLLIAGAEGSGGIFAKAVSFLAKSFTTISYDRRGHSQSYLTGEQDYSHRLERDADDAAELIEHVASTENKSLPAFVFGTSSGAIVASALLRRHANILAKVICHEPPLFNALDEVDGRDDAIAATKKTYEEYRAKGAVAALQIHGSENIAPEELKALREHYDPASNPYSTGNRLYWFERELLVYPVIEIDWNDFERQECRERLVTGISETGSHLPAARVAKTMGSRLGVKVAQFPGGHVGYLTHPEPFEVAVQNAFRN